MTPKSSSLPVSPTDAVNDTVPTWPPGVTLPVRMPEEEGLIALLRHWRNYGQELRMAAGTGFYPDTTFALLRRGWRRTGEGLLLLLHSQLWDLDAQALRGAIQDVLALPLEQRTVIPEWNVSDHWEPSSEPDDDNLFCSSREDALANGVLIDVTEAAKKAGFRVPVALTQALWADIHALPERVQGAADPAGRLLDVLLLGHCALEQQAPEASSCLYSLEMPLGEARDYRVKAVRGPGDGGEAVITLMQPGEE